MNNRYTNIGEAVVTSTVTGKAIIRVVQKRNFISVILWLLGAFVLVLAAAWLLRAGKVTDTSVPAAEQQADQYGVPPVASHPEKPLRSASVPAVKGDTAKMPASDAPQAGNELARAQQLAQQGKISEAIDSYRAALLQDAGNETARQAMVDLLLKSKRNADAERALQIGLKNNPKQSRYSMQLARLLSEKNEVPLALDVMQRTLPYAAEQADYQALYASLLQRQNQHNEAVTYYQKALALKPGSGEWLMAMGISLKALGQVAEADDAFKRALETHTLSPQSRSFVERQVTPPAANLQ